MSSNFKFYRYEGYSYRVELDPGGNPIAAYILQLDGVWSPLTWGWQAIIENNPPITEEQAFMLAGIKNLNHSTANIPIPSSSSPIIVAEDISPTSTSGPKILDGESSPAEQK